MQTLTASALQVLGFVKEDGIWYADLPQFLEQGLGTKANLNDFGSDCKKFLTGKG
jgi:hypothetical protein